MEYSHSDTDLSKQPIGYWSWAAHKAVITRTRTALAEIGTTQPQWWVLAQVARADTPKTRTEVARILQGYAATLQDELWAERHADVSDEEYLITLKVLQRFIHNTGGRAWHH
ncbi:MarR family transcriptional regulator [Streptomyces griseorubiginosus]|uniref:Uncharacterized protein n=1 Tax=Streptomyces griseorubiginosus TaxID=67304 RepID=A0AAI8KUV6_9ACTN|nr:MarR family transcriptional regulator [Streptomyces griseorubiginosus]AYC36193.1 hypothetical protein DWG14_00401 [Streptomyces griseorubiginosus]